MCSGSVVFSVVLICFVWVCAGGVLVFAVWVLVVYLFLGVSGCLILLFSGAVVLGFVFVDFGFDLLIFGIGVALVFLCGCYSGHCVWGFCVCGFGG